MFLSNMRHFCIRLEPHAHLKADAILIRLNINTTTKLSRDMNNIALELVCLHAREGLRKHPLSVFNLKCEITLNVCHK